MAIIISSHDVQLVYKLTIHINNFLKNVETYFIGFKYAIIFILYNIKKKTILYTYNILLL